VPEKLPAKHGGSKFLVVYFGYVPALRKPYRFIGASFFVGGCSYLNQLTSFKGV
jgi:hypothetical protein